MAPARDARLEIIHRAGHGCTLEQPEPFANAVRRFARSIGWWSETGKTPTTAGEGVP